MFRWVIMSLLVESQVGLQGTRRMPERIHQRANSEKLSSLPLGRRLLRFLETYREEEQFQMLYVVSIDPFAGSH